MYQDGTQQQPFVQKPGQPKFVTVQQSVPLQTNGPNELTWISSASTESEGTETDPMTKLFTSRGAEGRVEGVAPPGVEPGGRAVGGSLWTTCMTFP